MSTKPYLKFRTIRGIPKSGWVLESPYSRPQLCWGDREMGTAISCNVAHHEPHPLQREEGSGHAAKGVASIVLASIVHVAVVVHTEVKRLKYFLCVAD